MKLLALPKAWPNGSISGLWARGAVEVDLAWQPGKCVATLRAAKGGKHVLRVPEGQKVLAVTCRRQGGSYGHLETRVAGIDGAGWEVVPG